MSLILDALKQAESERGRGALPGVFSQPPHEPGLPAPSRTAPRPLLWLLIAAACAALLGYMAWPHTPWGARPVATPSVPVPVLAASATTTAPAVAAPAGPAAAPGGALFNQPAPAARASAPPSAAQAPERLPTPAMPTAPPAATAVSPLPPYTAPASPLAAAPTAAELPAEARAQLPSINITGHTFSDNPTLRMLMIDGHMFVEGQLISPGLRVERIGPHQTMLNHRGTRFSVDY